jgi:arylsulfatase A-like enzyme
MRTTSGRRRAALAAALLVAAAAWPRAAPAAPARAEARGDRPALVVLLVVDQLARWRLDPSLPGGLGRLLREGRAFADATLAHGITETCPGHAAISTGVGPGRAGIPGNSVFVDGHPRYCALSGTSALLRVDGLADRVRAAGGRAVAISEKDRAALMLGGRGQSLAIWLDPAAGFVAARREGAPPPPWLARFDAERGLAPFDARRFPAEWTNPRAEPRAFPDGARWQSDRASRASPHPVRGATLSQTVERLLLTPLADALTLDLARAAVAAERLGAGRATDLLAVSLSANDYVGHAYGPDSQEALAALRTLDAHVGAFLRFLEERIGRGRLLVALTADHGVTPIPELAEELLTSECRAPGGRVSGADLQARLAGLAREACRLPTAPDVAWDGSSAFALGAETWRLCGRPREEAAELVAAGLASHPAVVKVWTARDVAASPCAGACALYRASWDAERSGDWVVQLDPGCLISSGHAGAGHGSPYLTDRAVPVVFWGSGVARGTVRGAAHTIDVAPTLAARAGLPAWPVDGRALPLR